MKVTDTADAPDPVSPSPEGPTMERLMEMEQFVRVRPEWANYEDIFWNKEEKTWDAEVEHPLEGHILDAGSYSTAQTAAWASDIMKIKMLLCGRRCVPHTSQEYAGLGAWRMPANFRFYLNFSLQTYLEDLQLPQISAISDWEQFQCYLCKGKFIHREDSPSREKPKLAPWPS